MHERVNTLLIHMQTKGTVLSLKICHHSQILSLEKHKLLHNYIWGKHLQFLSFFFSQWVFILQRMTFSCSYFYCFFIVEKFDCWDLLCLTLFNHLHCGICYCASIDSREVEVPPLVLACYNCTWQHLPYISTLKVMMTWRNPKCPVSHFDECLGTILNLKIHTDVNKAINILSNQASPDNTSICATVEPTRNILLSSSLQSFLELCFQGTLNLFGST